MNEEWGIEEICTHLGDEYGKYLGAIVPPVFQTSLFTRKNGTYGYDYTRVSNPTTEVAEKKIAALEGGEAAICFASGMAAISSAIMHCISKDSHIIAPKSIYGPARAFMEKYLSRFGIETTFVEGEKPEEFEAAIRPNTTLIYLESPSSIIFSLQDLTSIAAVAKEKGIYTVIDNTWATPIFQNPLKMGIDIVVHSASKYMGGHSDIVGGALISRREIVDSISKRERQLYGAIMDPHQSWLLLRGLRTLPLRMEKHQQNAIKVALFLESHHKVKKVLYPGLKSFHQYELACKQMSGFSGLMSFVLDSTPERIIRFVKKLKFFEEGPSWGGFESLINPVGVGISEEVSKRTGIPVGLVRISVGLENPDVIIDDLFQALQEL